MNEHEKTDMFEQAYGYSMGVSWFILSVFLIWNGFSLDLIIQTLNFETSLHSCLGSTEVKKGGEE